MKYEDTKGRSPLVKRSILFFLRPTITKKIFFGYLSLVALIIIISVFALSSLERVNVITMNIIQKDVPVIEATDKMIDELPEESKVKYRQIIQ